MFFHHFKILIKVKTFLPINIKLLAKKLIIKYL